MSSEVAALVPLAVVAVGFEAFCIVDAARSDEVRVTALHALVTPRYARAQ